MKHWTGVIGAALLVVVGALWMHMPPKLLQIAGEPAPLARADAESEFILPEALQAAREQARRAGVRVLVVHRHGHRVFEYFAAGDGSVLVDGGELAAAALALVLHEPRQAEVTDAAAAATLVSERLWLPLRAADAWLAPRNAPGPRRCCIRAQLDDWMRVGDLLLGQGAYHGERFIAADAARALLQAHRATGTGDEPLLAREPAAFDFADGARLWLAPQRNLAVLVWAEGSLAQDTLLPNIILRGLNDAAPAIDGIKDLVPGH